MGFAIAAKLVTAGVDVSLGVRNAERGQTAVLNLQNLPGATGTANLVALDLASLDSVDQAIAQVPKCDFMVLNAGMIDLGSRRRQVTADGFEMHLQTNYLGHFALVNGLMPELLEWKTRVVVQSSLAAKFGRIRWDDLQLVRHYSPWKAYAQSKLALTLWTSKLARAGLSVSVCDPGVVPDTGVAPRLRRFIPSGLADWVGRSFANTPDQGALPALEALQGPHYGEQFYTPSGWLGIRGAPKQVKAPEKFTNRLEADRLITLTESILR